MSTGVLLSRFDVAANSLGITAGTVDGAALGAPVYIPAGTYYLHNTDATTEGASFMDALDALLTATWAGEAFACAYSLVNGRVTLTCSTLAGNWTLTFNQALANVIGFGDTLGFPAQATPATGNELAQYAIFAGSGRQKLRFPSDIPNAGHRSGSGVSAGAGQTDELLEASWTHGFERETAQASPLESGTKDTAGTVRPWVWADFFAHHRRTHHPFRYYDGAAPVIGTYERKYKLAGKSLAKFDPDNQEDGSWFFWQVALELQEWKAAT